jgi:hypothetical protein
MNTAAEIRAELERRLEPTQRVNSKADPDLALHLQYLDHVPEIKCADGFKMSVQASKHHYCSPRDSAGPWKTVEVGFPSAKVDVLMPYAEEAERPTETVYGYVPLDLVVQAIAEHDGFAA